MDARTIPYGFDTRRENVMLCWLETPGATPRTRRHLRLVMEGDPVERHGSCDAWVAAELPAAWEAKYGEDPTKVAGLAGFADMPGDGETYFDSGWADHTGLGHLGDEAPFALDEAEATYVAGRDTGATYGEHWAAHWIAGWRPGMVARGRRPTPGEAERLYAHLTGPATAMGADGDERDACMTIAVMLALCGAEDPYAEGDRLLPRCAGMFG